MEQSALRNAAMAHLVTILCSIHSRVEHFRFVGLAFTLNDADMLRAVTAFSGGGPAYVFVMTEY